MALLYVIEYRASGSAGGISGPPSPIPLPALPWQTSLSFWPGAIAMQTIPVGYGAQALAFDGGTQLAILATDDLNTNATVSIGGKQIAVTNAGIGMYASLWQPALLS